MKSLKIDDSGDIVFNSLGKLDFVSDLDMLKQSINLRIQTEKNELFYNESYGRPKLKGKLTKDNILSFLNYTLLDEPRILSIELLSYTLSTGGRIDASVLIRLNTNEILDFNFLI